AAPGGATGRRPARGRQILAAALLRPHGPARQRGMSGILPMIHPELAPSRSRWVVVPFLVFVVLAAAWTGFWFYASSTAQATLAQWREQEARLGRTYSCGSQSAGGYPSAWRSAATTRASKCARSSPRL